MKTKRQRNSTIKTPTPHFSTPGTTHKQNLQRSRKNCSRHPLVQRQTRNGRGISSSSGRCSALASRSGVCNVHLSLQSKTFQGLNGTYGEQGQYFAWRESHTGVDGNGIRGDRHAGADARGAGDGLRREGEAHGARRNRNPRRRSGARALTETGSAEMERSTGLDGTGFELLIA